MWCGDASAETFTNVGPETESLIRGCGMRSPVYVDDMKPVVFPGQRYGSVVVVALVGVSRSKKRRWMCHCDCGTEQVFLAPHLRSGRAITCTTCSRRRDSENKTIPIEQRFWDRVQKTDGCWHWAGFLNQDGYGLLSRGDQKVGAHRLSWQIHNGEIPAGMNVCHRCDNPQCTRPDHLFLGTQRQNMQDCASKGRVFIREQRGAMNASARLTDENARMIRERYAAGELQRGLANEFNVSLTVISALVRGRTYVNAGGPVTHRYKNQKLNERRWGTRSPGSAARTSS